MKPGKCNIDQDFPSELVGLISTNIILGVRIHSLSCDSYTFDIRVAQ